LPALLELHQHSVGTAHGVGVAGHALRATVFPLGHQLSTFQHGHVLLHGCKRHLVARGQLADGRIGVHHARQDVAPRGIGQRPEQVIQVVGRRLSIYNHMVVHSSTDTKQSFGSSQVQVRGGQAFYAAQAAGT
jgi:hypothetical protein